MRWVVLRSGWRVAERDARERGVPNTAAFPPPPVPCLPLPSAAGARLRFPVFLTVSSSLWPRLPAEIDSQQRGDPGGCCLPHRHGPLWHGVTVPAGWVVPGMGHSCAARQDRGAPKEHPSRLSSKMARLGMAGHHPPKCQPPWHPLPWCHPAWLRLEQLAGTGMGTKPAWATGTEGSGAAGHV